MGNVMNKIRALALWLRNNPFIVDVSFGVLLIIIMRYLLPKETCLAFVRHNPWQLVTLCVIVLFRTPIIRILNELPGFIQRSYYRQGADIRTPLPDAIPIEGTVLDSSLEDGDKLKTSEANKAASILEHRMFEMLREEYGTEIHERMSIGTSHYYFDGVMEYGGRLDNGDDDLQGGCRHRRYPERVRNRYDHEEPADAGRGVGRWRGCGGRDKRDPPMATGV